METGTHARFVGSHSTLQRPSLVPEIVLHLAGEVMTLWNETEALAAAEAASLETLPPPYWAFAWPGGQALARYIFDNSQEMSARRALDFGAGSGLVAIAAAKAGAAQVIAAEIDPLARAAIALNAEANGVAIALEEADVIGASPAWDTVLVGDMCYERPLAERLVPWLRDLARAGTRVLIGDPGRNYFPRSGVVPLASYLVPTSRDLEDRDVRETLVYALQPH